MPSASKTKKVYPSNGVTSGYYNITASFVENSTDIANNTSNITLTASIESHNASYSGASQNTWDIYWIDNNQNQNPLYITSESITSLSRNTTKTMTSTVDIPHKSDGNLTGHIQVNYNNHGTGYAPSSTNVSTDDTALSSIPRYAVITNFNVIPNDETSVLVTFAVDSSIDYCQYRIGTPNTEYWTNWIDTGVSADSRTFTIGGLNVNEQRSFQIRVRRTGASVWSESNRVEQTTYDYPKVTSANDFNIGSNPTFYVYNPLRRNITIDFIKASTDATYFSFIGNMNENYSPDISDSTSQEVLYGTLTAPTNDATYKLKVTYGSSVKTYSGNNKYIASINQCKPELTASIQDVNSTILALTNDNSQIVKGFSTARITPTVTKISSAYDLNATISKYIINGDDVTGSYKDITNAMSIQYPAIAVNNRNFESDVINSTGAILHPYFNPTVDGTFDRPSQTGDDIEVAFAGTFYNAYFDTTNNQNANTLTIKWYVRLDESDAWTLGGTLIENTDYTITNNNFSSVSDLLLTCPQTISSGTWDYMTKYYFKLEVIDELQSVSFEQYVKIGQPYFNWWTENGVNYFNVYGEILKNNVAIPSLSDLINTIYPVGSIYISVNSTNPGTLFGGTWVAFGEGRTLVGMGSYTDSRGENRNFQSAEYSFGEYQHQLSVNEMPSHSHPVPYKKSASGNEGTFASGDSGSAWSSGTQRSTDHAGNNQAHNNCQPSITVYMWKRTA